MKLTPPDLFKTFPAGECNCPERSWSSGSLDKGLVVGENQVKVWISEVDMIKLKTELSHFGLYSRSI